MQFSWVPHFSILVTSLSDLRDAPALRSHEDKRRTTLRDQRLWRACFDRANRAAYRRAFHPRRCRVSAGRLRASSSRMATRKPKGRAARAPGNWELSRSSGAAERVFPKEFRRLSAVSEEA